MTITPKWKKFGAIEGVPVGTHFKNFTEMKEAGVHGRVWGIHGIRKNGAYSIVLNGGGYDDEDRGNRIVYTGHGKGISRTDTQRARMLHQSTSRDGPQRGDQQLTTGNKALQRSCEIKNPVRVIRGEKCGSPVFKPNFGYRYDGLYQVNEWRWETDDRGNQVCKFVLERLPDQAPLPNRATPPKWWSPRPPSPPTSSDESDSGVNSDSSEPAMGTAAAVGATVTRADDNAPTAPRPLKAMHRPRDQGYHKYQRPPKP